MNAFRIALNDIKMTFRSKVAAILLIVMPVCMVFLMGYAMKPVFESAGRVEPFSIIAAAEDPKEAELFVQYTQGYAGGLITPIMTEPDLLEANLIAGGYPAGVHIPMGLMEQLASGEPAEVTVIGTNSNPVREGIVRLLVESFVTKVNLERALNVGNGAIGSGAAQSGSRSGVPTGPFVVEEKAPLRASERLSSFQYFAASMLVFFLLTTGMGLGTIITERENGLFARVRSFPVKDSEYLLGKALGNGLTGILQAAAMIVVTTLALQVEWGTGWLGISLTVILMIFISSGIGVVFSSFMNSEKALTAVLSVVFWLMTFISGGFTAIPIFEPIARYTVNRWAFDTIAASMTGGALAESGARLAALFGTAVLIWLVGVMMYRRRAARE